MKRYDAIESKFIKQLIHDAISAAMAKHYEETIGLLAFIESVVWILNEAVETLTDIATDGETCIINADIQQAVSEVVYHFCYQTTALNGHDVWAWADRSKLIGR